MKALLILLSLITLLNAKLILPKSFRKKLGGYKRYDIQIFDDTSVESEIAGVQVTSGYATVQKNYGSALYYFYTEAENTPAQATVIWLSGGPGCSSFSGALMEDICAIKVGAGGNSTYKRPNSWGDRYGLLFIDQPIGTGYSTRGSGPYRTTTWQSANDFAIALDNIREMHPEWFERDLYIFGESYAGHYVPAYAYVLYKSGKWDVLKGIGVGDGIHDGYHQLSHNADQSFSLGFITLQQYKIMLQTEEAGRKALESNDYLTAGEALNNLTTITMMASGGVNPYNSRQFTFPDMPNENQWLNTATTKRTLGIPQEKKWNMCDDIVNQEYAYDIMTPYVDFFDELLSNMRVLLYCGQDDIIINAASWQEFVKALQWGGRDDFNVLERKPWHVGDNIGGYVRQHQNLTEFIVLKSGHMVPQDQPAITREMIRTFIDDLSWDE